MPTSAHRTAGMRALADGLALAQATEYEEGVDDILDDEFDDDILLAVGADLCIGLKAEIGGERLSLARLQRDAAAAGCDEDMSSRTCYLNYRFTTDQLPLVVRALRVPAGFRTKGRHVLLPLSEFYCVCGL